VLTTGIANEYRAFVDWVSTHRGIPAKTIVDDLGAYIYDPKTAIAKKLIADQLGPDEAFRDTVQLMGLDPATARVAKRSGARPVYAVQTMPMFVVGPERAVKYYALPRLALADAFVVTSSIRERYRGEPTRYAHQVAFYDSLEARWPKAAHFEPNGGPGPAIDVYRNPDASAPFGERPEVLPADSAIATSDPLTGAEAFWYVNMGLNHELAGHDASAEACYRFALRFGRTEPVEFQRAALLLANLHDERGRREEALRVLDRCARIAPSRGIAETLQRGRERLARGLPVSVKVRP
jgi:tetratricopeptide (TPR) repeat protein